MNYTKGEWRVYTTQPEKDTPLQYKIVGKDGEICHVKQFGINSVETKANAHLIAAAPKMYEALQYIKSLMEKCIYKDADTMDFGAGKLSIEREIAKALAKAEGRE